MNTKKTMLTSEVAKYLVDMWSQKGQISMEMHEATLEYLTNREFDDAKITRWAKEVRAWQAAEQAA